jgi:hypothetical protein
MGADGTGSRSYPSAGFDIGGVEHSDAISRELASHLEFLSCHLMY